MEKLLVVEDEKAIRETLQEILEMSGYEVITARNGKEGYKQIMDEKPDLVLCDVSMPEMDGFELLSAINQVMANEIVPPFVFLTAKVELKDVRRGMTLGADDYVLKPFDHMHVLEVIRLRLDKRKKLLQSNEPAVAVNTMKNFDKLALPSEEGLELVPISDIVRCQADRAYCTFHLADGRRIVVSKSMKEFEDILIKNNFIKVHKSTIVNIQYANKYLRGKGGQLIMSDGSLVHVAVRKKDELMKALKI